MKKVKRERGDNSIIYPRKAWLARDLRLVLCGTGPGPVKRWIFISKSALESRQAPTFRAPAIRFTGLQNFPLRVPQHHDRRYLETTTTAVYFIGKTPIDLVVRRNRYFYQYSLTISQHIRHGRPTNQTRKGLAVRRGRDQPQPHRYQISPTTAMVRDYAIRSSSRDSCPNAPSPIKPTRPKSHQAQEPIPTPTHCLPRRHPPNRLLQRPPLGIGEASYHYGVGRKGLSTL